MDFSLRQVSMVIFLVNAVCGNDCPRKPKGNFQKTRKDEKVENGNILKTVESISLMQCSLKATNNKNTDFANYNKGTCYFVEVKEPLFTLAPGWTTIKVRAVDVCQKINTTTTTTTALTTTTQSTTTAIPGLLRAGIYICHLKAGAQGDQTKQYYMGQKDTPKECFHACLEKKKDFPKINHMIHGVVGQAAANTCWCNEGTTKSNPSDKPWMNCFIRKTN